MKNQQSKMYTRLTFAFLAASSYVVALASTNMLYLAFNEGAYVRAIDDANAAAEDQASAKLPDLTKAGQDATVTGGGFVQTNHIYRNDSGSRVCSVSGNGVYAFGQLRYMTVSEPICQNS